MLENSTILIGKDSATGRLLISTVIDGKRRSVVIGDAGSVPGSVSRCLPAEGVAHCKITVGADGVMVLTNLKSRNVTYVNDMEIVSKRITPDSHIALGCDRYALDLAGVIAAVSRLSASSPQAQASDAASRQQSKAEYSIKGLKPVWEEYHNELKQMRIRQKNIGLLSGVPMAFSMFGGLIAGVVPDIRIFALIFTGIALIIMIIGLYYRFTDKTIERTEQLTEHFQDTYVCPNPSCRHFMGNLPYNILRQNTGCPYCKCKFTEK